MIPLPHLSIQVVNFAAEAPDDWKRLLNHAMAADRAGVDRIAVSDHVVFGDDFRTMRIPRRAASLVADNPPDPTGTGWSR